MALSPTIEAAKNEFAALHRMPPGDSRTLEAFFTHQVLLHRNLSDFAAERLWRLDKTILVGGNQDTQLDAILVLVNNDEVLRPGDSLEELEQMVADGEPVRVSFVFVQATGKSLGKEPLTYKMSAFSQGVYGFLDPDTSSTEGVNGQLSEWIGLKRRILEILNAGDLEGCCDCAMYFVSPRRATKDTNVERIMNTAKSMVRNHQALRRLFSSVEFLNLGEEWVERMIADSRERTADLVIQTARYVKAPAIPGVEACYCGFMTAEEVLGLVTQRGEDEQETLRQGVFSSNVRGFLGASGAVNTAIASTIANEVQRGQFGLRSNGLAIVAKSQQPAGPDKIRLTGAQIVNGCQTSHMLFALREKLKGETGAGVWLPVKIIVTPCEEIEQSAILGLNRQTPVHETQVYTERGFVDRLAHEFQGGQHAAANKAMFERREGEHHGRDDVDVNQIVSLYDIAQAYVAAFLGKPEQVSREGKQPIIEKIRTGMIFARSDDVLPYYVSGIMVLRARQAVVRNHPKRWRRYAMKNMVLYAMRLLAERKAGLATRTAETISEADGDYFTKLGAVMLDPVQAEQIADSAVSVVAKACAAAQMKMDVKSARDSALTAEVAKRVVKARPKGPFAWLGLGR